MADEATTTETTAAETTTATETATTETSTLLGVTQEKTETTDTTKTGEEQAPDKDAKPAGAPEKYEFTPPEGMELDPVALGKFEPIARELNLDQEQANKLVGIYAELAKGHNEAWAKTQEDWRASVTTDQEFGGEKLETTLRDANLALTKFAQPADIAEIKALGLANCPPLVKLLARAGALMGEDKIFNGNGTPEANTEAARAARMFPSSK